MNFVYVIACIWLFAAIGSAFTGDGEIFGYAFWATVLIGLGYLILRTSGTP